MSSTKHIALVMDAIESLILYKDTSILMAQTMQSRGWKVDYIHHASLALREGMPIATAQTIRIEKGGESYQLGESEAVNLIDYDCIFMRQDPPFNKKYVFNVMVLQRAEKLATAVINTCGSLLCYNEKLFATEFPDLTAPTLVSRSQEELFARYEQMGDVVVKPLDGMGGKGIFHIKPEDDNATSIIETVTKGGNQLAVMQNYLPEVRHGDKRIFLIDGEPIDYALARIPKKNEARANLAAGGTGQVRALTERDRHIANSVGTRICGSGLYFVGLDVIGDYLTEINVTSPTGARELLQQKGVNTIDILLDTLLTAVL